MKRAIDIVLSALASLFLLPVIFLISVLLLSQHGRPILFRQTRPGIGAKPFAMIKFRTMSRATGVDGQLLSDGERLTRLGRFLRSTSLDELPELWNVLKGDMSLVGPRPLLMEYLPLYSPEQARRHEVRPGVTGWAQVNGRNTIGWDEKFALDVWYVDHQSVGLDIKILSLTAFKVFARHGISAAGEATMTKFQGSQD